jgi:hypothetical protein
LFFFFKSIYKFCFRYCYEYEYAFILKPSVNLAEPR